MTRTILRRFLDKSARHWAIIVAILGIGLAAVLPAADEMNRTRRDRARLEQLVAGMRREVADLDDVRRKAEENQKQLAELEALAVAADQVPLFRQEIVDWARQAGCQIRRIRLESPRSREWQDGDSLVETTSSKRRNNDSPYRLNIQPLSVSVSGTLSKIKRLLNQLRTTDRLIQYRSLTVSPSTDNRKEVVLNIDLMLFDLAEAEAPHA